LDEDMARETDDLTEADRQVMRLYEEEASPIEWDASDEAVMAFAREIHAETDDQAEDSDASEQDSADTGTVVPFAPREKSRFHQVIHSPAMGFSLAACLMIGVFAGQGLNPYIDLGVSSGYQDVVQDNKRLQKELNQTRTQLTRSLNPSGGAPNLATSSIMQVAQTLGGFDCSTLTASMSKDLKVVISGHVSSEGDLRHLGERLAQLGSADAVVNDAKVAGWPACEALGILHHTASAQSAPSTLPIIRPFQHGLQYSASEKLIVEVTATSRYDGYLYVDFIQQDGTVVHMLPGPDRKNNAVKAGERILLGDGKQEYTIAPPFGREMLVVTSSPKPLFDKTRPQVEKAKEYLAALRGALAAAEAQGGTERIVSNYTFITTGP
jgi:Domain of unknown function (DUF4384)